MKVLKKLRTFRDYDIAHFHKVEDAFNELLKNSFKLMKQPLQLRIQDHFVDRINERNLDKVKIILMIETAFNKHLCEIVYFTKLETRPVRLVLHKDGYYICFTFAPTGILTARTVINNHARYTGRVEEFIIEIV